MESVLRKRLLIIGAVLTPLGIAAWANGQHVIGFTAPSTVVPGSSLSISITVNQAPMSVTFTSSPSGLVSYTTTVTSTTASVSVPTSSGATEGDYTVIATPTSGGTSKTRSVAAVAETPGK